MSDDPLLTLKIGEAWRTYVYTANCSACKRWTRVDLKKLAGVLGHDFPLRDLRPKLRCSICRGKRIIISTADKSSTSATSYLQRWPFDYD